MAVYIDNTGRYLAGADYFNKYLENKFTYSFREWLGSVGGEVVDSLTDCTRYVVRFENEEDAIIFKLKYM